MLPRKTKKQVWTKKFFINCSGLLINKHDRRLIQILLRYTLRKSKLTVVNLP